MKRITRADIKSVVCPACGAEPKKPCIRKDGTTMKKWHEERAAVLAH